jgi:Sulfate permease family
MIPTTCKRRTTACRRQPFHPTDRGADAHLVCPSGTSTRDAFLNGIDHALTQVQRIAGWHGLLQDLSPGRLASHADSRKVRDARRVERIGKCSSFWQSVRPDTLPPVYADCHNLRPEHLLLDYIAQPKRSDGIPAPRPRGQPRPMHRQTAAVAGTFPSDEGNPENVSRDFAGVGAGCILAGLIGAFAVDSSPPSTAIVHESGGRSQIASLTAVALMVALAVAAAGLMAYVPHAALSGILLYIALLYTALRIFRLNEMIRIYRDSGPGVLLVAASAALAIALPIETGMLLAIVLSFVHSLYIVARPYCVELPRVPGSTYGGRPVQEGRASTRLGYWSSHLTRRSTSPTPSASVARSSRPSPLSVHP